MPTLSEKFGKFAAPGSEFRGAPFWALTGKLKESELIEQIRTFKKMGLGGFFLHARIGLETEYLSEEWFHLMQVCVDEARKLNMKVYLYDEDRYSSGIAGGLAVREHPEYRQHRIFLEEVEAEQIPGYTVPANAVGLFAAVRKNFNTLQSWRPVAMPGEVQPGETLLVFTYGEAPHHSWYNGYCYLDALNKEAVQYFLEVTHEQYFRHFHDDFGALIPAIFGDEPHYGFIATKLDWEDEKSYSTPWNDNLGKAIQDTYQVDLQTRLPELFFDVEGEEYPASRYWYVSKLTELFLENYLHTIGEWCEAHHIQYTGHVFGEDTLASQTWGCGSCMRAYRYFGMPGMDQLGETTRGYQVAKQLSSAARQLGKAHRLTETYGCTGWDFPLMGHKAIGDWQVALGVNFRCMHLAHYTIAGEAKRDYPASISYQSPWHEEYGAIEDYFGRLNLMLIGNAERRDVLVFSPIESAWLHIKKGIMLEDRSIEPLDKAFLAVQNALLKAQLDFDLADEAMAAEMGRVTTADDGAAILQIGCADYRAVVLPEMLTIRSSTVELLKRFLAAGGKVFSVGAPPQRLDALPADGALAEFAQQLSPVTLENLSGALAPWRRVEITDAATGRRADSMLIMESADTEAEYLFINNTGFALDTVLPDGILSCPFVDERNVAVERARLTWRTASPDCRYWQLDAAAGTLTPVAVRHLGEVDELDVALPALASVLFMRTPPEWSPTAEVRFLDAAPESPNVLTLDRFEAQVGDTVIPPAKLMTALDDAVRNAVGLPKRNFMMIQPWFRNKFHLEFARASAPLALRTAFTVESVPQGELYLALEEAQRYRIFLNGTPVANTSAGWFLDREIAKVALPQDAVHVGLNTLTLECEYDETHRGLEAVYLLGDFGVKLVDNQGVITAPRPLLPGNMLTYGMPFFTGWATYRWQVSPFVRKIALHYAGSVAKVRYQGRELPLQLLQNDCVELPPGGGLLEVRICVSPRNACGPFYWQSKRMAWCGPDQFTATENPVRQLVDAGLMDVKICSK